MTDNYFMDGHKLLWHFDKVLKVKKGEQIAPIYLEVSPVSFCNHACNFCGKDFVQSPNFALDLVKFNEFIQFAAINETKSIMFAGEGEPLLHPHFDKIVSFTKDSGIDLSLTTNGSRLTSELATKILPKLTWLRFSVNGATPEVYSKIHSTGLTEFEKVTKNIKNAISIKNELKLDTTIGLQFVVVKENEGQLQELLDYFLPFGLDYISIKPFSRNPKMLNSKIEIYNQALLTEIDKIQKYYEENKTATEVICRLDAFSKYYEGEIKYSNCHALPYWAYITASGDFYTCPIHIGDEKFKVGNINIDSPELILFGEKRQGSLDFASQELDVKKVCRVNCRMARVNEFLEELQKEPKHVNFI